MSERLVLTTASGMPAGDSKNSHFPCPQGPAWMQNRQRIERRAHHQVPPAATKIIYLSVLVPKPDRVVECKQP